MGVKKYKIVAVLDIKTSNICRELDGKVFDMKDFNIGITAPPFHPHCRSVAVPYINDETQRKMEKRAGRAARDPVTGKTVTADGNLTYKQWHEKYVKDDPAALAKEKVYKNRFPDKKQYDKYKKILGKNAPRSFNKFQEIKYNNKEEWERLKEKFLHKKNLKFKNIDKKADSVYNKNMENIVRESLKKGIVKDKINVEKQRKHVEKFAKNSGKSYIFGDEKCAENLYNKLKGTGTTVLDTNGNWLNMERVVSEKIEGVYKNENGDIESETKNLMIVYSKTGSHIYPRKDD